MKSFLQHITEDNDDYTTGDIPKLMKSAKKVGKWAARSQLNPTIHARMRTKKYSNVLRKRRQRVIDQHSGRFKGTPAGTSDRKDQWNKVVTAFASKGIEKGQTQELDNTDPYRKSQYRRGQTFMMPGASLEESTKLDEGSSGLKRTIRKVKAIQKMNRRDPETRKVAVQTTAQLVRKRASRKARLSPASRDFGNWAFANQPAWERPKGDNPNLTIHRPDLDAYGSKLSVDRHSRKFADLEDTARLLKQRATPPYTTSMEEDTVNELNIGTVAKAAAMRRQRTIYNPTEKGVQQSAKNVNRLNRARKSSGDKNKDSIVSGAYQQGTAQEVLNQRSGSRYRFDQMKKKVKSDGSEEWIDHIMSTDSRIRDAQMNLSPRKKK